jgi:hypothetical protein
VIPNLGTCDFLEIQEKPKTFRRPMSWRVMSTRSPDDVARAGPSGRNIGRWSNRSEDAIGTLFARTMLDLISVGIRYDNDVTAIDDIKFVDHRVASETVRKFSSAMRRRQIGAGKILLCCGPVQQCRFW